MENETQVGPCPYNGVFSVRFPFSRSLSDIFSLFFVHIHCECAWRVTAVFPCVIMIFFLFQEFEDLDEIIARHIQPMASFARDILAHKYYKPTDGGNRTTMQEHLKTEKAKAPKRIPYFLSSTKEHPGKFLLGYMPRTKPRIEFVSVTPDGYKYRGRIHATLNALFKWFKEHFRDPIPGM